MPNPSLQTRFVLLCVLLSTVSAAVLGGCLVWLSVRGLREQAQAAQLALARSLANQVEIGVSQAYQTVAVLAEEPDMVSLRQKDVAQELSLVTSTTELLDNILVVLPNGRVLARSLPEVEPEAMPKPGKLLGPLRAYKSVKASQVLADIFKTPQGEPAVAIRAPIRRDGKLLAVVVGVLYLGKHSIGSLDSGRIGRSGYAVLVSEDGLALVHPNKAHLLEDLSASQEVKQALHQQSGQVRFSDSEGQDELAAFVKVPSADWSVVVRQPVQEVYEPAATMLRFMSLFLLLAVAGTGLISAWVARRLAQPILRLAAQVRSMEGSGAEEPDPRRAASPGELSVLEKALQQLGARLRQQRRSRDLAHRRALEAERGLQQAERLASVGQLAAGLAHELNNPLTVILGAAREAATEDPRRRKAWLQKVSREVQRCKRLIQELLDFTRPIRLQESSVALAPLCREAWAHAQMGRHNRVRLSLPDVERRCWADESRLRQVLVNLFSNALDAASPKGRVELSWQPEGKRLRLELQDSGPGIGARDPEELFRPFYTDKPGGTGLGLPISRAIVQAHGGELRAEKRKDGRLRFILSLAGERARPKKREDA